MLDLEKLQSTVRDHWRRGVLLLQQDWEEASEYSKFVEILITRRAALPSDSDSVMSDGSNGNQPEILVGNPVILIFGS